MIGEETNCPRSNSRSVLEPGTELRSAKSRSLPAKATSMLSKGTTVKPDSKPARIRLMLYFIIQPPLRKPIQALRLQFVVQDRTGQETQKIKSTQTKKLNGQPLPRACWELIF